MPGRGVEPRPGASLVDRPEEDGSRPLLAVPAQAFASAERFDREVTETEDGRQVHVVADLVPEGLVLWSDRELEVGVLLLQRLLEVACLLVLLVQPLAGQELASVPDVAVDVGRAVLLDGQSPLGHRLGEDRHDGAGLERAQVYDAFGGRVSRDRGQPPGELQVVVNVCRCEGHVCLLVSVRCVLAPQIKVVLRLFLY